MSRCLSRRAIHIASRTIQCTAGLLADTQHSGLSVLGHAREASSRGEVRALPSCFIEVMPSCICTCLHEKLVAEQGNQDAVPEVPSELVLRTESDIISTFGKGGAAAKSPVAPHPPPLMESELPYSSSSEDGAGSDASSLAHETDHAARHSSGDARHHLPLHSSSASRGSPEVVAHSGCERS